jgi:hypothetical protein
LAVIAASCALPEYEVGESGSSASASGGTTSSSTGGGAGGKGGAGGENVGGMGGNDGMGGTGGMGDQPCPFPPPPEKSPCPTFGATCSYPSKVAGKSCCEDKYVCQEGGGDPSKGIWTVSFGVCAPDCPQDCSICPKEPSPACECRPFIGKKPCTYSLCPEMGAKVLTCEGSGVSGTWQHTGEQVCCNPQLPECPENQVCLLSFDASGQQYYYCQ